MLNSYLAETHRTEDLDGLAALPFFLSMRAAIRAKVTAARMERAATADQAAIAESARAYFAFAQRAIAPPKPALHRRRRPLRHRQNAACACAGAAIGPMPGAVIVRSDVERKALFGVGETEKLPEDAYSATVNARVYAVLADKARRILGAGHAAIVDAVFAQPSERTALAATAKAAQVPLQGLFLTANLQARLARVDTRRSDASDADPRRGAGARKLRPWRARLAADRCLRHARRNCGKSPRSAGLTKRSGADIKRPESPSNTLKALGNQLKKARKWRIAHDPTFEHPEAPSRRDFLYIATATSWRGRRSRHPGTAGPADESRTPRRLRPADRSMST